MFALRFIAHSKARFKPDNTWVSRKPKINLKIMPGPQQTILSTRKFPCIEYGRINIKKTLFQNKITQNN